jgi:hypothetical protein
MTDTTDAQVLERRLNTPSTFDSRKAAAAPPPEQRLVFMGTTEKVLSRGINDTQHEVIEVELYFDAEHSTRTYYRLPGGVLQATVDNTSKTNTTVELPPMKTKPRFDSGLWPECPPDVPAKTVT